MNDDLEKTRLAWLDPQPEGYAEWLTEVKARVHAAQQRAALAVNQELLGLYWQLGRDILERQNLEGWGAKVVDRLAHDLKGTFPEVKGFSPRNLKYMRRFAEAWPDLEIVQQLLHKVPWFHLCTLLDKVKDEAERDWYVRATVVRHTCVQGASSSGRRTDARQPRQSSRLRSPRRIPKTRIRAKAEGQPYAAVSTSIVLFTKSLPDALGREVVCEDVAYEKPIIEKVRGLEREVVKELDEVGGMLV